MIISTEKLFFDLVKTNKDTYRRFSENHWEIFADEVWEDWSRVNEEELEKEYQKFKEKEYQDAFLNAP